ncbi:MAG: hypothetical protein K1X55_00140 [Chitinophagales bacterium]|nr:hypothetical protein [Chitinophagales bacterium]
MRTKKYIGKFLSIKYADRETPFCGFVLDYNDHWTLMKYSPFDYEMDGYILLRHHNIQGFQRTAEERFKEKLIVLKGENKPTIDLFPLGDLQQILEYLSATFGVFSFDLRETEDACYLGKLHSFGEKTFTINYLNPKGVWLKRMKFKEKDVRTIQFDTNYINTLHLYACHRVDTKK